MNGMVYLCKRSRLGKIWVNVSGEITFSCLEGPPFLIDSLSRAEDPVTEPLVPLESSFPAHSNDSLFGPVRQSWSPEYGSEAQNPSSTFYFRFYPVKSLQGETIRTPDT